MIGRCRGKYDSNLHRISNDFGLVVANMFTKNFGATPKKVIVNSDQSDGKIFVKEDYGWDLVLTVQRDKLPIHFQKIIGGTSKNVGLAIEIEAKKIKEQYLKGSDTYWPSMFKTVDFGWVKYRDPKNPIELKSSVKNAIETNNVHLLHFLCLFWEKNNSIEIKNNNNMCSWLINFNDLDKQMVDTKRTMRGGPPEKFYMVDKNYKKLLFINLSTGELENKEN